MNYRHAFHAGNFADAVKHVALVSILTRLRKKEAGFAVFDSHAGCGLYDLSSREANATGEARAGIARLRNLSADGALGAWLELERKQPENIYSGSPIIAAELLRAQDRLVAAEMHDEDRGALKRALAKYRNARIVSGDGYAMLAANLPPRERRGLIVIDPPFEEPDEFERLGRGFAAAFRRFATGVYLVWFPLKVPAAAEQFCGEALAAGVKKALRVDIAVAPGGDRLAAAGLFVANPPFGFADEMTRTLEMISKPLGARSQGTGVRWLVGSD